MQSYKRKAIRIQSSWRLGSFSHVPHWAHRSYLYIYIWENPICLGHWTGRRACTNRDGQTPRIFSFWVVVATRTAEARPSANLSVASVQRSWPMSRGSKKTVLDIFRDEFVTFSKASCFCERKFARISPQRGVIFFAYKNRAAFDMMKSGLCCLSRCAAFRIFSRRTFSVRALMIFKMCVLLK